MLAFPLSELQQRLARFGFFVRPCDNDDDHFLLMDVRDVPCGILHLHSLLHWLCGAENWRQRFAETPLTAHDQIALHFTFDLLSTHALNEADTINAMADCGSYTPGKLRQIRLLLASVLCGFTLRLIERRFNSANPEIPGGIWPIVDDLRRLAEQVFEDHRAERPIERIFLDNLAMSLACIHLRLDEWLSQPDRTMQGEPVLRSFFALSRAIKSLLRDIALIRGGNWQQ